MAPERMVSMSKKLQKRTSRLRRKAQSRVLAIGRAVREYRDATSRPGILDATWQTKKSQDIEVAVERYNQVHKKLRRINKKSVD
jgi:hypothetical protein